MVSVLNRRAATGSHPEGAALLQERFRPHRFVAGVEARLRQVLDEERSRWSSVDSWLPEVVDTLSGFVLGSGKRIRPLFCAYGFLAAGGAGEPPALLDIAAALELLHAFALLHDDVMDGSATRRGRPSLHRQLAHEHAAAGQNGEARRFGDGVAVLVGDLSFALSQRLVAGAPPAAQRVWHDLCAELVMGQYLDVAGAARGCVGPSRALTIARYKSGKYTVERPIQLGTVVAGLSYDAGPLSRFARPLGEAFQLRDDLLGAFGDERCTGKPSGDDLREAKPTLLLALAIERATGSDALLLERVGSPDLSDAEVAHVRRVLVECGASHEVERMIGTRYRDAINALTDAPVPAHVRPMLSQLAARALWRAA